MTLKKVAAAVLAGYIFIAVSFYYIAGDGLQKVVEATEMVDMKTTCGEIVVGSQITQAFYPKYDSLEYIRVKGATYARENDDTLLFSVLNASGEVLATARLDTLGLENGGDWTIILSNPVNDIGGQKLILSATSERGQPGNAVTFCYGDAYAVSRYEIPVELSDEEKLHVDQTTIDGTLCMSVATSKRLFFGEYYWIISSAVGLVLLSYFAYCLAKEKRGERYFGDKLLSAFDRYGFLLKTLVSRDFKTKYKRSALGVLWSFLNPLLTMLVLYLVFSTLFKSSIENYPVYLLSGLVCWNFFSEATTMCLTSITGNAPLITKVYVPKYIYPVSRTVSSLINFLFALIPLFVVMAITGCHFTIRYVLIVFGILSLVLASLGVGMLLGSAMVFFRDVQFLWGVISMLWMYLTPIFYSESIIPKKWLTLYKLNPLYHIIRIFRIVLIEGRSPEPKAYGLCLLAAVCLCAVGVAVFKKTQDRFILHI